MKICSEIRCPFDGKNGCTRYAVSGHCHLLRDRPHNPGEPFYSNQGIRNNQYWLFADDNETQVDINALKDANDRFIAGDEFSQKQLQSRIRFGE